jgi:hypothetical protein
LVLFFFITFIMAMHQIPINLKSKIKVFPHGIGMQTLNSTNLTPVQDGADREDQKCVKKVT